MDVGVRVLDGVQVGRTVAVRDIVPVGEGVAVAVGVRLGVWV